MRMRSAVLPLWIHQASLIRVVVRQRLWPKSQTIWPPRISPACLVGRILYLHKITDNKMTDASQGHLHLLRKIVGDDAFTNVILFTTMWNTFCNEDRQRALQREQELIGNF
ncbi:5-methylthioadenosine/S-adenosylhomocysteine deaminase [Fusarium oxysporum f. sp. albedinis]|nr:5-methylthioadenosine/S-adenosylhomocysteine deaminase [Fusarium oxysporum f. sp. albedinis]